MGKKHPKFLAKKVTVVKQTVHNLQTGTFKAKGIDQQKRFEKVFITVLKHQKKQFIRAGGVGWTRYTRSSSPNPLRGLCAKTRLKNQTTTQSQKRTLCKLLRNKYLHCTAWNTIQVLNYFCF